MFIKKMFFLGSVSAALFFTACEKDSDVDNNEPVNQNDRAFINAAASANQSQVVYGQLALTQSENDTVRAFSQTMIDDYQQAWDDLDSLAGSVNIELPDSLTQAQVALRDRLQGLSGYDFDTAYINSYIAASPVAIQLFESAIANGQHAGLKAYATRYLETLREHKVYADSVFNVLQ